MKKASEPGRARAVIVISSHVMRGSVGNRAAVFALEALGHSVWAVPTVILPWHPGHGPSTRIVPPPEQFEAALADLATSPWLGEVGAIVSGYLGDPRQAKAIAGLVGALRKANPHALYVCDPVIGDRGGLYVPEETATAIRDGLFAIADLATPNRFELEWLIGRTLGDNTAVVDAARMAPAPCMVVTSAHPMLKNGTGNLLVTDSRATLAEHRLLPDPPNGLGDLISALFTAHLVSGVSQEKALRMATASVFEVLARTVKTGANELLLQANASSLTHPMAQVEMRVLQAARPAAKA